MLSNRKKRESRGEIWDLFFPWHLAVAEAELVDLREGIELVADPPVADLEAARAVPVEGAPPQRAGRAARCVGLSRDAANLTGLVLGCIEAKFCK